MAIQFHGLSKLDAQKDIDKIYGEGEWELIGFKGGHEPATLKHKCGKEKLVSRYSTFKQGGHKCECNKAKTGRKPITEEEMAEKIRIATNGMYELIEFTNSTKFTVNHISCERKPIKTSSIRFFTRGQRCACCKKGVVGRKNKREMATLKED